MATWRACPNCGEDQSHLRDDAARERHLARCRARSAAGGRQPPLSVAGAVAFLPVEGDGGNNAASRHAAALLVDGAMAALSGLQLQRLYAAAHTEMRRRSLTDAVAPNARRSGPRRGGDPGVVDLGVVEVERPGQGGFAVSGGAAAKPQAQEAASFPELGVSLRFLQRILQDGRLRRPMCTLPFVSKWMPIKGKRPFGPAGTLVAPIADLGALDDERLLDLAWEYRLFSDRADEWDHYTQKKAVTRDALLAGLRRPPRTTTQVVVCIIKPDTLKEGCSFALMMQQRGGALADLVGRPTIFVSHAWRYDYADFVGAVEAHFAHSMRETERGTARLWNGVFV